MALHGTVLSGRSYEAEARRPYGPWIDAIRSLHPSAVGDVLRDNLAPLLTGLVRDDEHQQGKDQLFTSIVELLSARAHSAPPVLLVFDDVQWCDAASAELQVEYGPDRVDFSTNVLPSSWTFAVPAHSDIPGALIIWWRDAQGTVVALHAISIPPGDFAAG